MLSGCHANANLPQRGSKAYADVVSAFYVGLAALQVGDDVHAESKLSEVTQLVPAEPAGWANWGVLALRQRNYDLAAQRLERARDLAPQNDQIYNLLGILEGDRGRSAEAIADLRKSVDLNPKNLRAAYALAEEIERQGDANSEAEFQEVVQKILAARPDNLAALLELARVAAKRGDASTLTSAVTQISARSSAWPPEVQQQLATVQAAAAGTDPHAAATRTTFLRNVLMRVPDYRQSLAVIKAPAGEEAQPLTHFVRLESPVFKPAPADTSIKFATQPVTDGNDHRNWNWIGAIQLGSAGAPVTAVANGREVHLSTGATLPFPGGPSSIPPSPEGVLQVDFNYDFKTDLVLAGAGGVRLYRQNSPSAFTDVTPQTKLPKAVTGAHYTGAWAVDIEADGDLDIVMGASEGLPVVLRNNGDGTFLAIHPFAEIAGVRGFAWVDLDGDGNPDAALIDGAGRLHVFMNERQGQFHERALPAGLPLVKAIAVADANNDGVLDLLAVQADGAILRISDKNEGQSWDTAVIARAPDADKNLVGEVRLHVADLDNNGALDLFLAPTKPASGAAGALIWLGDDKGSFVPLDHRAGPALVFDAADLKGNGKLDLLGLAADGQPVEAMNQGSKGYHWQVVRAHAVQAVGDQRINPFGIGGEIEIRSGFLLQLLPITGPQIHFGLGEQTSSDVIRVLWPNGSVRAEFEVKADQEIVTEQRIKGSCPYLFAYNGKQLDFVKDAVPWSSAIGLRINTLGTARVEATEEWYKIGHDELVPHDGFYDLRITAELWETYYYDYLALTTVDHPIGTDIFVDERFVIPPAKLAITAVSTPHKIAQAVDDNGQDVTDIVSALDGRYLDTFGRGQYQGITRDHYVEVNLGEDAPKSGPLYLILRGWMHPTDSSVNVAISQGMQQPARGLSLEVPDGHGGWAVARPNLGFPAGRKKICLVDLTNVFRPNTPRRVRLRTNLEIYWDSIEWAQGLPNTPVKTVHLDPTVANLHYRGYSVMNQANPSSPEIPDYNHFEGSKQRWRDLVGYYTRFGDVRELLAKVDDRYVIMNSGDEMTFRFAEQPPPPPGWVRDYLIMGDGWIKDGDYNSTFGKTVLPLPYHAKNEYTTPPGRLEDEWPYRHHPEDWNTYQTRYVTPDVFKNALRDQTGK